MFSYARYLLAALIAMFSASTMAQTEFEKIDVGTVLTQAGIKLGVFVKPIPLPEGEWQVVSKRIDELPLKSGNGVPVAPAKKIWLTLKNKQAATSPMVAIVMGFTPDTVHINWGNRKCENSNPKALVDDFGANPDSVSYVCATAWNLSGYKKRVASAAESKNKWDRDNLVALTEFSEEIPDKVLSVDYYGNQYGGRAMNFVFLIKRDADLQTDPSYAQYVKEWMHANGLALINILKNDAASFTLPAPFTPQAAQ